MIQPRFLPLIFLTFLLSACGGDAGVGEPTVEFDFDRSSFDDDASDANDASDVSDGDADDEDSDADAGDDDRDASDGDASDDEADDDEADDAGDGEGAAGAPSTFCDSVACGQGSCVDDAGGVSCACDSGFQDFDGDLVCEVACAAESCSGLGSCDDASGSVSCSCDLGYAGTACESCAIGFQDFDGDLVCEAACSAESCSSQGSCDDVSGSVSCSCDLGYAGTACESCDTSLGYEDVAGTCRLSVVGTGLTGDPYQYFDGRVAADCQEYRFAESGLAPSALDGVYLISASASSSREVTCDMTTDGGGWTLVEPTTGLTLTPSINSLLSGSCILENGAPLATDAAGDSACQFDYDLGFDFNQLRAFDFEVEARTGTNQTTDIGALSLTWLESCGTAGDIRIGAAGASQAGLSLGRGLGYGPGCGAELNLQDGQTVSFSDEADVELGSVLRVEMYEAGSEAEGWTWSGGTLGVRKAFDLMGSFSEADPGRYADGAYAAICADYFQTQFVAGELRAAAPQSGYFTIDSDGDGPNAPETTFCAPGGGEAWTPVLTWNRKTGSDSLTTLLASMTDDLSGYPTGISKMGSVADVADAVRWSDGDSSEDALSLSLDVSGLAPTEMYIEVDFYGYSMEDSGIWFSAESATSSYNLVCNDHATQATIYSSEEKELIAYSCAEQSSGDLRFNGSYTISAGESLERFRLLSLMSDINEGDYAELYRLNVAVR